METAAISLLQQHGTKLIYKPGKKEETIQTAENSTFGFAHDNQSNSDMCLSPFPDTHQILKQLSFPAGPPL